MASVLLDSGLEGWGLGFRVEGLGFMVQGLGLKLQFRVAWGV